MKSPLDNKKVLLVAANPAVSTTTGWPVGFWASEVTHPLDAFTAAGIEVTIASPRGGRIEMDAYSNPLDESGYSAQDSITLTYLDQEWFQSLLSDTPSISQFSAADFDAILVAGGMSPMFTFKEELALQRLFLEFLEQGKIASTLCHGTALLLSIVLDDGRHFVTGKRITGFCNEEEDAVDQSSGTTVMPFRIEAQAAELGAIFEKGKPFEPFVVKDGNLITGQQPQSGRATAEAVIAALEESSAS